MGGIAGSVVPNSPGQNAQAGALADATKGYGNYRNQVWDATRSVLNDAMSAFQGANNALASSWGGQARQSPHDQFAALKRNSGAQTPMGMVYQGAPPAQAATAPVHPVSQPEGPNFIQSILDPAGLFR